MGGGSIEGEWGEGDERLKGVSSLRTSKTIKQSIIYGHI